ncbi:uncharacterized protein MELLADRAFT_115782 [Melampsora larici-populina 98AG31]|uniref:Uncharacterized protein n=1 Tax=Melampsora larici-populina (strain 98AG31 / pathotype 3-4-7) TaxID=747676 RepID=F4RE35_MELLP|nr:uncharacterized protein MELLADRAFT_115782 [Melampsora larici-populina 98AG31]EGG09344.1 hypothetical protein MELLADRAFT_115782 [Melampsora larici-populina 98AG31]
MTASLTQSHLPTPSSNNDSQTHKLKDESYFTYSHHSASHRRRSTTKNPWAVPKPDEPTSSTSQSKMPAGSSSSKQPAIASKSRDATAPTPPQSRSPPHCTCKRPSIGVDPLTTASSAALKPTFGSTSVGSQEGYAISPSTSLNRDQKAGVPRMFPRQPTAHHPACPVLTRFQISPPLPLVSTLDALRNACNHTPPRVLPAPPPLSERLRAKWAEIQAAEALAKHLADSSADADSCTKLPRRKRTIKRQHQESVEPPKA